MVAPQTFKYVHDTCVHVPFDNASKRPVPVKVGNFTAEQEGVPLTTPQHATQQIDPNLSPEQAYLEEKLRINVHGRERNKNVTISNWNC